MKKTRRFLCLLLTLVLALSLCAIPAAAADTQTRSDDPVVFVHGLMGWGQRAGINAVLPYWGMTTGSLTSYLNSLGYETYSATVGPISSAWDRACELYAQLTGTTVDYGAAHLFHVGKKPEYRLHGALQLCGERTRRQPRCTVFAHDRHSRLHDIVARELKSRWHSTPSFKKHMLRNICFHDSASVPVCQEKEAARKTDAHKVAHPANGNKKGMRARCSDIPEISLFFRQSSPHCFASALASAAGITPHCVRVRKRRALSNCGRRSPRLCASLP